MRVCSCLMCKEEECHRGLLSSDYRRIQSEFFLCKVPSSARDIHQLNGLLRNAFTLMAMLDYPYSTQFIGNLPANPVKVKSIRLKSETIKGYLTRNSTCRNVFMGKLFPLSSQIHQSIHYYYTNCCHNDFR